MLVFPSDGSYEALWLSQERSILPDRVVHAPILCMHKTYALIMHIELKQPSASLEEGTATVISLFIQ